MFPALPNQSRYNKRSQGHINPLLCKTILTLASCCPSFFDDLWITDATPGALRMSKATVKRSDPAGHANYGYCASHTRWYWGLKLYLVCTGDGMPIMWCLADPKIGEREVLRGVARQQPPSPPRWPGLVGGQGVLRCGFKTLSESKTVRLLRPDRQDEIYRNGKLGGVRQWIESVNQTLKGQLGLERHAGRTPHGVFTRVAQRLLAMAAGIWHNWQTDVTSKRSLIAYDH